MNLTTAALPELLGYVTTVHRPGLPDVHLGFAFQHQAEHASWSLREDLISTQHVPGTTITWSHTPDGVTPHEPTPTDPLVVADLVAQENRDLPEGHNFPDLFSRLKAQEGYERAARIHTEACRWLDHQADAEPDANGR